MPKFHSDTPILSFCVSEINSDMPNV